MLTNDYGEVSWVKVGLAVIGVMLFVLLIDFLFAHTNNVSYASSHITRMEESSFLHQYCAAYVTTYSYVKVSDGHGGYTWKRVKSTDCAVYDYYRTYTCDAHAGEYDEYYNKRCSETGFRRGDPVNVMITTQQDMFRLFPPYEVDNLQAI